MRLVVLIGSAIGVIVIERSWPANALPKVRAWWPRVIAVNLVQGGIIFVSGYTWDRWLSGFSLFDLKAVFGGSNGGVVAQGALAYFVSTFVYYWWHRWRHESRWLWRICHQLHHSPARIELVTSFYKHPVEITINSILSSAIVYALLGCSPAAGIVYTFLTAVAEYFYHWNIKTPHWLGYIIQRPESHCVHHEEGLHAYNYGDLPVFDWMFGTLRNPREWQKTCGLGAENEHRVVEMLTGVDVTAKPLVEPGT
jgi:sterol desaturase/sphingolipid hydroxylase (fatty acid hydroxylase superfamily)